MKNAIQTLRIQNFKSIKDVTLTPRRVNIIIGEPNVGKSNILEAMSLLGGMFFDGSRFMDGQIRYENIRNLFYDNDWSREILVEGAGVGATRLRKRLEQAEIVFGDGEKQRRGASFAQVWPNKPAFYVGTKPPEPDANSWVNFEDKNHLHELIDKEGQISGVELSTPQPAIHIRKYAFQKHTPHGNSHNNSFLRPPYGDNLLEVLQTGTSAFRREIAAFFTSFGLNLALRLEDQKIEIQKNVDGVITSIPYALIADTLQRIIFYLAAIESNDDAVLLLEEPEAHSYPVYVSQLGRRIVESRNNQFFVATHSPYLINEVLENMLPDDELAPELAMFVAYYEDYQTKVHQLSDEQVRSIRRDSLDVFYNMARFVPRAAPVA